MTESPIYGVLLFGAPGVGKGTQGKILHNSRFFHLSVGDVFRSIDIGSPVGREIYRHTSRGELVPDDLTMKIWRRNLEGQTILNRFKPHEDIRSSMVYPATCTRRNCSKITLLSCTSSIWSVTIRKR
ncbi:MAG: nucleoside monophosphate kinase [Planctomycetaceae bacterium]